MKYVVEGWLEYMTENKKVEPVKKEKKKSYIYRIGNEGAPTMK